MNDSNVIPNFKNLKFSKMTDKEGSTIEVYIRVRPIGSQKSCIESIDGEKKTISSKQNHHFSLAVLTPQ